MNDDIERPPSTTTTTDKQTEHEKTIRVAKNKTRVLRNNLYPSFMITPKNCTALLQIYSTLLWISKNQFLIYVPLLSHGDDKVAHLKKNTPLSSAIVVQNELLSMKNLLGEAFGQGSRSKHQFRGRTAKVIHGTESDCSSQSHDPEAHRLSYLRCREVGGMMRTTIGCLKRRDTD